MILPMILSLAAAAHAALPPAELALADELARLRRARTEAARTALAAGAGEELRDAVSAVEGEERRRLAARLPGMAVDPFNLCRGLLECREAPAVLHVEDHALVDDAILALARPWFRLQEARGKAVKAVVDPGAGVRLELEGIPGLPSVTLAAAPTPTGGYDIALEDAEGAARAYAAARAAVLSASAK